MIEVRRWRRLVSGVAAVLVAGSLSAQGPEPATGVKFPVISQADLKTWLSYLASDETQGRQVFTEGYGIAAQYVSERLREFGVKPLGDHGTYFQIVKVTSYRVRRNSSVTIERQGQARTFKDGDHVAFPADAGGKQTVVLSADQVSTAMVRGALPAPTDVPPTTRRIDAIRPPALIGDDVFFAALSPATPDVRVTIQVDNTYQPLTTQLTRNVVGLVEGTDPKLKVTYVLFGAHLDHVGYATSAQDRKGVVNVPIDRDPIWNGADDDGTGSTAELGIAKAFATGPKPKRSIVFLWHAGEEADLYGSLYNADFPVVPIDKVQCELNIDMIGRNRDNDVRQANTLFVIGADRISTDLHNLIVDTNAGARAPLTLDYEYNDPADPNSFYTRSDHFAYASKGIPIAFFFTGTHPDYHANTDSVDNILFEKQARIAQLVYQVGFAVADSERPLRRDNQGPRAGKGYSGRIR